MLFELLVTLRDHAAVVSDDDAGDSGSASVDCEDCHAKRLMRHRVGAELNNAGFGFLARPFNDEHRRHHDQPADNG